MTEFQQRKKRKINSVDLILIVPWFSAIYNKKINTTMKNTQMDNVKMLK